MDGGGSKYLQEERSDQVRANRKRRETVDRAGVRSFLESILYELSIALNYVGNSIGYWDFLVSVMRLFSISHAFSVCFSSLLWLLPVRLRPVE